MAAAPRSLLRMIRTLMPCRQSPRVVRAPPPPVCRCSQPFLLCERERIGRAVKRGPADHGFGGKRRPPMTPDDRRQRPLACWTQSSGDADAGNDAPSEWTLASEGRDDGRPPDCPYSR
uniref:Uncharacterized protein n=1 Tax=Plectus sambesii TaxID=2011161 RepID=A0A914X1A5_9BILA